MLIPISIRIVQLLHHWWLLLYLFTILVYRYMAILNTKTKQLMLFVLYFYPYLIENQYHSNCSSIFYVILRWRHCEQFGTSWLMFGTKFLIKHVYHPPVSGFIHIWKIGKSMIIFFCVYVGFSYFKFLYSHLFFAFDSVLRQEFSIDLQINISPLLLIFELINFDLCDRFTCGKYKILGAIN